MPSVDFRLDPAIWHAEPLVFSWDRVAGTVTGPGAAYIVAAASRGEIAAHPLPWVHVFSAEPLKSEEDMAAIIGLHHHLPASLAEYYPRPPAGDVDFPAESYTDAAGVFVVGLDRVTT